MQCPSLSPRLKPETLRLSCFPPLPFSKLNFGLLSIKVGTPSVCFSPAFIRQRFYHLSLMSICQVKIAELLARPSTFLTCLSLVAIQTSPEHLRNKSDTYWHVAKGQFQVNYVGYLKLPFLDQTRNLFEPGVFGPRLWIEKIQLWLTSLKSILPSLLAYFTIFYVCWLRRLCRCVVFFSCFCTHQFKKIDINIECSWDTGIMFFQSFIL